jgi:ATP-dependent helicase/nuclease subunit B
LLQLDTVLRALGYADGHDPLLPDAPWRDWAAALDRPVAVVSCGAPSPCPPVAARPTSLSVTEIGTWLRNPYAIYAKHVLKLVKLGELDNDIDAREKGNVIHQTLDEFLRAYPDQLPPDALDKLLEAGAKQFARYETHAKVGALWWPRFLRIAAWFIATERERRALGIRLLQAEASGRIVLDGFTLRGRADRIDRLPNGVAAITDYKTGAAPTSKQVESGLEPQLPLLALIAAEGGFAGLGKVAVSELSYWALSGGRQESEIEIIKGDAAELMEKSRVGLKALIDAFARADMPYEAIPKPWLQPRFDDYAHLARLAEWGRVNENN